MNKKELIRKVKEMKDITSDEKAYLIDLINTKKKYGLVWEDKPEDVEEQLRKQLPVFKEVIERAIISEDKDVPNHILIEGDNLYALTALTYTHKGKIDVIYIDPPYNTGARDWIYNNNYVDDTDSFRHSKWLSFMRKRLLLAKLLLAEDGIICVTIDDYEMPRLWMLLEEIFGFDNHLGTVVIRNNPKGRMTKRKFSLIHEYGIFFGKSKDSKIKKMPENPEDKTHNYKKDIDGSWYLPVNLRKQGVDSSAYNRKGKLSERYYPVYLDSKSRKLSTEIKYDTVILPIDSNGEKRIWRRSKVDAEKMIQNDDIWLNKTRNGKQLYFKFRGGLDGKLAQSIWYDARCSASDYGTKILDEIIGEREKFQYPKAPFAVKQSILSATNKNDAKILDFFAGSGTTLHATMELNAEDGGNRQCILVTNNENNIAEEVTYERNKRVIEGYTNSRGVEVEGLSSNSLRYYQTDFVSSKLEEKNRRILTASSTEMICIKEDCYTDITNQYKTIQTNLARIFTNQKGKYLVVIYHSFVQYDVIQELIKIIPTLDTDEKVKVYSFSPEKETIDEEFLPIIDMIDSVPLPESIYNTYRQCFRTIKLNRETTVEPEKTDDNVLFI